MPGSGYMGKLTWWQRVQRNVLLNFDWEMMTYWAIVGLSHALRYFREAQDRALRAAQLETHLAEAQLQALQRQLHPHFLFNTLNTISALMHRDVDAADRDARPAERPAPDGARPPQRAGGAAQRRARVPREVPRDRTGALRRPAHRALSTSIPTRSTRSCRTCCCSRSSRTAFATPSPRAASGGPSRSRRRRVGDVARAEGARQRPGAPEGPSPSRPAASGWRTRDRGWSTFTARRSTSSSPTRRAAAYRDGRHPVPPRRRTETSQVRRGRRVGDRTASRRMHRRLRGMPIRRSDELARFGFPDCGGWIRPRQTDGAACVTRSGVEPDMAEPLPTIGGEQM